MKVIFNTSFKGHDSKFSEIVIEQGQIYTILVIKQAQFWHYTVTKQGQ
jgi:hypothetical protein